MQRVDHFHSCSTRQRYVQPVNSAFPETAVVYVLSSPSDYGHKINTNQSKISTKQRQVSDVFA